MTIDLKCIRHANVSVLFDGLSINIEMWSPQELILAAFALNFSIWGAFTHQLGKPAVTWQNKTNYKGFDFVVTGSTTGCHYENLQF